MKCIPYSCSLTVSVLAERVSSLRGQESYARLRCGTAKYGKVHTFPHTIVNGSGGNFPTISDSRAISRISEDGARRDRCVYASFKVFTLSSNPQKIHSRYLWEEERLEWRRVDRLNAIGFTVAMPILLAVPSLDYEIGRPGEKKWLHTHSFLFPASSTTAKPKHGPVKVTLIGPWWW
ncbi:hypothetical protein EV421DRAFT_1735548 [Armillaria borealis]|uniref:Uncharacterized protein n=1 Tax=Armillaria borealis TaxID=47425 RepID=A0AA39MRC8_9AGAR|nr:hypothetical protein EV421DRAFT_1735548 [Armillaria borealis]